MSANKKDTKDQHAALLEDDHLSEASSSVEPKAAYDPKANVRALVISFVLMVVIGLGNKIFQVLQFIPMYVCGAVADGAAAGANVAASARTECANGLV